MPTFNKWHLIPFMSIYFDEWYKLQLHNFGLGTRKRRNGEKVGLGWMRQRHGTLQPSVAVPLGMSGLVETTAGIVPSCCGTANPSCSKVAVLGLFLRMLPSIPTKTRKTLFKVFFLGPWLSVCWGPYLRFAPMWDQFGDLDHFLTNIVSLFRTFWWPKSGQSWNNTTSPGGWEMIWRWHFEGFRDGAHRHGFLVGWSAILCCIIGRTITFWDVSCFFLKQVLPFDFRWFGWDQSPMYFSWSIQENARTVTFFFSQTWLAFFFSILLFLFGTLVFFLRLLENSIVEVCPICWKSLNFVGHI